MRSYTAAVIASTWPEEKPPQGVAYPSVTGVPVTGESQTLGAIVVEVGARIRVLEPADSLHQRIQLSCEQQHGALVKERWRGIEQARASFSDVFYWVVVFWLVILFASIGLTAPANLVTVMVVTLSAISVTAAMFLILELDEPYGGLFGVPSEALRDALADMMAP